MSSQCGDVCSAIGFAVVVSLVSLALGCDVCSVIGLECYTCIVVSCVIGFPTADCASS